MQLMKTFLFLLIFPLLIVGMNPVPGPCEEESEESEESVSLTSLPAAVRKAIGDHGGGVMPSEIEREESDGFVYFEAEFKEGDAAHEIKIDEEGRIVEIEKEIPSSDLPRGAMNQIKKSYAGYEIEEVEITTLTHYEIEIEEDGNEFSLLFLENGYQLGNLVEEDDGEDDEEEEESAGIEWDDLPVPVQKAVTSHRPDVKPEGFELEKSNSSIFYEAEYPEMDGVKHEIKLDELGNIIEIEDEMPVSKLPVSIRKQIESDHPNASIEEVELKQSTFYEVELKKGEEELEIRILSSGYLLGVGD